MKISLVVPVYNVEQYIERCLRSCLEQDIPQNEYEIIVVNDGSLDRSITIAEQIAATGTNITIISQENSGLSAARNKGLSLAKGEYIWFIDSDDAIKENCLKSIVEQCYSQDLDLLAICAANIIDNNIVRRFSYEDEKTKKGFDILTTGKIQHCAPFTIYKRKFLESNRLRFYTGIYHEDSEWSPRVYFLAKKVGFTNELLYFVTINPNSITRATNPQKGFDCLTVAYSVDNFYKTVAREKCSVFFHNHISLMINNALSNFNTSVSKNIEDDFKVTIYQKRQLFKHLCSSSILKYRIEGYLFRLFPKYVLCIYRLMQKIRK